ncbi:PRC-barrel domain-containing protein [Sphingomonas azotifigens]|uniref:PRC-barrel domain-containing protein n=1 Tax=Sphingomonas azotifigens TaxID=330920 RepID=UPI000A047B7E|nr:PRC-barrel domain-containing protein [Sphingomonas azotifigens]
MADIAGWLALAATCVAALMTASNLGARVTGWGFVVFTVGAAAWIVVGIATQQTQLLWSNIFLGLVDLFGIWRWLGRRARFSDAADAEQEISRHQSGENLFAASGLDGMPVKGRDGDVLAYAVDAMLACAGGDLSHLVIREGGVAGVGETLRRLPWRDVRVRDRALLTNLDAAELARLPTVEPA